MKFHILPSIIIVVGCIAAGHAPAAEQSINWRPLSGSSTAAGQPTEEQRQKAYALARESNDLLDRDDLPGGEAKLRAALAILPDKAVWHYNMACILAVEKQAAAAIDALEKATDCGFTDFTRIEQERSLKSLREFPRYVALVARKEAIRHAAGLLAIADLQQYFGKAYLFEVDEELKLVFAVSSDRETLEALKTWVRAQMATQAEDLFSHKPDEFIRVVLPSPADYRRLVRNPSILGIYEDETRTLLAQRLGQVMTHEFTHALHAADQRALGQEHPVWLREGLATMYEAGDMQDGRLIPHDNSRLGIVQSAARRQAMLSIEKFLALKPQEFVTNPNLPYGESGCLLLYLQEKKLLRKFYDLYTESYRADIGGQAALEQASEMKLPELQKAWTAWLLDRKPTPHGAIAGGAYLGVHFGMATDGLKVATVLPTGAAGKAGIKNGDVIVSFDGHEVRDYASFAPLLAAHKPGETVKVKFRRDGKYLEVPVVLDRR